jgi:ribosomal protein S18 acetylase RimI-like enzyme
MMPDSLVVRDFREGDARAIVRLHEEAKESFEDSEVSEEFIKDIAERCDFRFFVVADGVEVIGFAGVLYHASVGRSEVGPICVRSDLRHRGVGGRLLRHAVGFLRGVRVQRVIAKVKADNHAALGFFRHAGFADEGLFRSYTLRGEDVIQLVCFI